MKRYNWMTMACCLIFLVACARTSVVNESRSQPVDPIATVAPVEAVAVETPAIPQYDIQFRYFAPDNPSGQACTAQCEIHYNDCLKSQDAKLCQEEYHSCYRLCGGRVEQIRRCTANCPDLDPSV